MPCSLSARARALLPWLLLLALPAAAAGLWSIVADHLYVDLSGLSMMASIEIVPVAEPGAAAAPHAASRPR